MGGFRVDDIQTCMPAQESNPHPKDIYSHRQVAVRVCGCALFSALHRSDMVDSPFRGIKRLVS